MLPDLSILAVYTPITVSSIGNFQIVEYKLLNEL